MQAEMWRLYRHLVFGGVVIVVCCYVVMEFTQIRFGASKAEQLLCVDAEFSSALLLSGVSQNFLIRSSIGPLCPKNCPQFPAFLP